MENENDGWDVCFYWLPTSKSSVHAMDKKINFDFFKIKIPCTPAPRKKYFLSVTHTHTLTKKQMAVHHEVRVNRTVNDSSKIKRIRYTTAT